MPRAVVFDTDPGIDDAVAILLALAAPELDVRAIHTVAGNCPLADATRNARRILALAGRGDLPVHAGCPRPLLRDQIFGKFHGQGGLGGALLPEPGPEPAAEHAVPHLLALSRAAIAAGERFTICALGPLTNLATALTLDPGIAAAWEQVVVMGGNFLVPGNRTPGAEFNFLADPHAARIVLNSGADLVIMPLDVTHQAMATPERVAALGTEPGAVAAAVGRLLAGWNRGDIARYGVPGGPLHDPTVVAYLLAPALFTGQRVAVEIDCEVPARYGHLIADWFDQTGAPPNALVMTGLDAPGFFALLGRRLGQVGAVVP